MDRRQTRSLDRKLRSSLRTSGPALTASASPKPAKKKIRLSVPIMDDIEIEQKSDDSETLQPKPIQSESTLQNDNTHETGAEPIDATNVVKKARKPHNSLEFNGYTWHVNQNYKNGQTIYYYCSQ